LNSCDYKSAAQKSGIANPEQYCCFRPDNPFLLGPEGTWAGHHRTPLIRTAIILEAELKSGPARLFVGLAGFGSKLNKCHSVFDLL
jgi:hypothetical protein